MNSSNVSVCDFNFTKLDTQQDGSLYEFFISLLSPKFHDSGWEVFDMWF